VVGVSLRKHIRKEDIRQNLQIINTNDTILFYRHQRQEHARTMINNIITKRMLNYRLGGRIIIPLGVEQATGVNL
jgi:hypothetical protein